MIVCLCEGVSDREVRTACREGACSVEDVTRKCGAGGKCGGCRSQLHQIVQESRTNENARAKMISASALHLVVLGG